MNLEDIQRLDSLLCKYDFYLFPTFGLAIIAFFVFLSDQQFKSRIKLIFIVIVTILFLSTWLSTFFIQFLLEKQIKFQVLNRLNRPDVEIVFNNKVFDKALTIRLKRTLRTQQINIPNGTQTKSAFDLMIISNRDTLNLEVREDSDVNNEYEIAAKDYCYSYVIKRINTKFFKRILDDQN